MRVFKRQTGVQVSCRLCGKRTAYGNGLFVELNGHQVPFCSIECHEEYTRDPIRCEGCHEIVWHSSERFKVGPFEHLCRPCFYQNSVTDEEFEQYRTKIINGETAS